MKLTVPRPVSRQFHHSRKLLSQVRHLVLAGPQRVSELEPLSESKLLESETSIAQQSQSSATCQPHSPTPSTASTGYFSDVTTLHSNCSQRDFTWRPVDCFRQSGESLGYHSARAEHWTRSIVSLESDFDFLSDNVENARLEVIHSGRPQVIDYCSDSSPVTGV